VYGRLCAAAADGVVITVVYVCEACGSDIDISVKSPTGAEVSGCRVRKQNVSGCRTGTRVERSVEREVSPGAGVGAAGWDVMV